MLSSSHLRVSRSEPDIVRLLSMGRWFKLCGRNSTWKRKKKTFVIFCLSVGSFLPLASWHPCSSMEVVVLGGSVAAAESLGWPNTRVCEKYEMQKS